MKRIDAPGHVANLFTDGDPGAGVQATVVDASWLNSLQEEVSNVIEGAGLVLDPADDTQLLVAIQQTAAGGGGGGGFKWTPVPGETPVEANEYDETVFLFTPGITQRVAAFLKIPDGYTTGKQIKMNISYYSTSAAGTVLYRTTTTLIRKNLDPIDAVVNQHVSTNLAVVNALANQFRVTQLDLTDALGKINAVSVTAGDLLKISLTREIDLDATDVRLIPNATEIKFG